MHEVVAVRFRSNPRQLWFDPHGVELEEGDHLIVSTDRGQEICLAVTDIFEASDEDISALPTPLKPVIRVANEADLEKADELARAGEEALPVFRELVEESELDMKPVRVEYLFSGEKAVFYFASEERIDFRGLVRDLANRLHVRVDMRQIGVRDEARLVGGLSHCGQELCCSRLGGEFQPVSIRMAKEQDLPLNPQKISGVCGRLMCCLRYEFEAYKDFKGRAPKKNALIETPLGIGKVVEFNTPRELVTLRFEDGKQVSINVADMESDENPDGTVTRPCRITAERLSAYLDRRDLDVASVGLVDRELEDGVVEEAPQAKRTPRRRNTAKGASGQGADDKAKAASEKGSASASGTAGEKTAEKGRSRRRRRGGGQHSAQHAPAGEKKAQNKGAGNKAPQQSRKNASGNRSGKKSAGNHAQTRDGSAAQAPKRQPRRRHTARGDGGDKTQ